MKNLRCASAQNCEPDAQTAIDRYMQVDTEIRRLVKGDWKAPKVSRAQLIEATLKMQQVFGNAAKLRALIANIFEEQLVSESGKKSSINYGDAKAYVRTKLLAGPHEPTAANLRAMILLAKARGR